ncbi:MAG TPA: UDP-N-acetylmuramate dehydrogenase [Vicinamibacterales bacterium]|nr:UDP-N-acetylmuramate dehydrogenase [Vicinamibacterales bacterium]
MNGSFDRDLRRAFGEDEVHRDISLAPFTTFRTGGPADWLVELHGAAALSRALALARDAGIPITILGGGSNILVADAGVRGLVVRMRGGDVTAVDASGVRADAGVTINGLVRWTIIRGISGLEAWAGTPGTVGGAIYGNAHFQGRLIGELVERVTLVASDGRTMDVPGAEMEFAYDYSRLHRTKEIVAAAEFRTGRGEPSALRSVARASLAFRKRTQPLESASAGCIFQNPHPFRDSIPDGIPASAGALVDRAGFKGARVGQAMVSHTHANFIVNLGGASARDIRDLIDRCKRGVREQFGVELREEIVCLGFGGAGVEHAVT